METSQEKFDRIMKDMPELQEENRKLLSKIKENNRKYYEQDFPGQRKKLEVRIKNNLKKSIELNNNTKKTNIRYKNWVETVFNPSFNKIKELLNKSDEAKQL